MFPGLGSLLFGVLADLFSIRFSPDTENIFFLFRTAPLASRFCSLGRESCHQRIVEL